MGQTDAEYLTTGEAARRLHIARMTVLRAVKRGAITPAFQTPGGCWRFRAADVAAYAEYLRRLPPHAARAQE